jgi:ubiquinone/menaquinone biosynthesis C-methylase UbiE
LAADYALLTRNLCGFYNFVDKSILVVGAGHGHLLDPAIPKKKLIAVDRDVAALQEFQRKVGSNGNHYPVEVLYSSFEDVRVCCDVVYMEFCLHEMANPFRALKHARTLAPDVVVYDHSSASKWIYYGAEEDLVRRSSLAMKNFGIRRCSSFRTFQRFADFPELYAKISRQGPVAVQRIGRFYSATNFVVPMICELLLL